MSTVDQEKGANSLSSYRSAREPGRILIVDDDGAMLDFVEETLRDEDHHVWRAKNASEAWETFQREAVELVVTDVRMPGPDGLSLCEKINAFDSNLPVIVTTAFGDMEMAISAIRSGAYDFLQKPFEDAALLLAIERALKQRRTLQEVVRLKALVKRDVEFSSLLGESEAIGELKSLLSRLGSSSAAVLIQGETGTGKELVAREIHAHSPRNQNPFVAINCAALPPALLESELFGHKKGAFTDAKTDRVGLIQQAHTGTLFLDEIGDMPSELQVKLLRVLQEKKLRPIGANEEIEIDIRSIAATHCDLEEAIDAGRFREDLYYRLNVIQVDVPPLRQRGNDVLLLAGAFLREFAEATGKPVAGITAATEQRLRSYSWPGNVRELRNCIEHAVTLCTHSAIGVEDLPSRVVRSQKSEAHTRDLPLVALSELETMHIKRVLEYVDGNKARAARILGLDRRTLYRKLAQFAQGD